MRHSHGYAMLTRVGLMLMLLPLQVCCSSPERFLRMGRGGLLEAKPIKGTAPRAKDPLADSQAAAELAGARRRRQRMGVTQ